MLPVQSWEVEIIKLRDTPQLLAEYCFIQITLLLINIIMSVKDDNVKNSAVSLILILNIPLGYCN